MNIKITWYDNAAFRVDTIKGTLWFDPSVNKNPASPIKVEEINEPAKFVFTTHGHPGHFLNSVEVTKRTGALFIGSEELCSYILNKRLLPKERVVSLIFGKSKSVGDLEVYLFEPEHPELSPDLIKSMDQWGGVKTRNGGFIVQGKDFSLCHMGDCIYTDIFQKLGEDFKIDIGMIPIQGKRHIESSPAEAAKNGAQIIKALKVKTIFPIIQYTKEQNRIEFLQKELKEMRLSARLIFDRPGVIHTLIEFGN
jgi:L-ascorbate metabolism protein UlaG (beta-lactamase superfamily)